MRVEERLEDLGLELLEPPKEKGKVAAAVRSGNLVFTSGHPSEAKGRLGREVTAAEGYLVAQDAAVRCLSAIKALIGDLDHVTRVVKVTGFVNCTDEFTEHAQVMHGATELLTDLFGEDAGWHVRSVVGVAQLPDNAAVVVEMTVEVSDG
ncbi:MAG: RidA family protein [Candidatus Latescibacteria bacterium]|nr:RidA family protein [Candidatus Latescibacterota bacterium]